MNEPDAIADEGYGQATMAPGISNNSDQWIARYNTIRAHSEAFRIYEKEFESKQKGKVGITLNTDWIQPLSPSSVGTMLHKLKFSTMNCISP